MSFADENDNQWQNSAFEMQQSEADFRSTPPRGRILLVEDEEMVRAFAAFCLEQQGYEVFHAADASEAAYIWSRENGAIDLLLTDISLPGLSGVGLAENLRSINPDLPVVFTSGFDEGAIASGVQGGYVAFLAKPYSVRSLIEAVKKALPVSTPALW